MGQKKQNDLSRKGDGAEKHRQNVPRETVIKENRGHGLVISGQGVRRAILRAVNLLQGSIKVSYKYT